MLATAMLLMPTKVQALHHPDKMVKTLAITRTLGIVVSMELQETQLKITATRHPHPPCKGVHPTQVINLVLLPLLHPYSQLLKQPIKVRLLNKVLLRFSQIF